MKREEAPEPFDRGRRSLRVAGTIVFATLLLRVTTAPSAVVPSLLAAAVDAVILIGLCLSASLPPGRTAAIRHGVRALFGVLLFAYGSLLFWHSWFLDIGAEYRFSLVGVTPGAVVFFWQEIVPRHAILAFAAFWVLVFWSRTWTVYDRMLPDRVLAWSGAARLSLGALLLVAGLGGVASRIVQHPLRPSLRDVVRGSRSPDILANGAALSTDHLNLRRTDSWPVTSRFRRVLVFVMEGVSRSDFEAERTRLPVDGFFRAADAMATKYVGYYTVNQESRTARMAMLHSLMIPYEAYVSSWMETYGHVYEHGGMVSLLNSNGWRTAMAIPLVAPPWDLRGLPWTTTIGIEEGDMGRQDVICLAPTEYDRGCEDRVLLAQLDSLLDRPEPTFLFQPFLFGHTGKWEAATGTSRVAYYDRYLSSVLDLLRAKGALDETLIIVTSDHGPRTHDAVSRLESYEVPLWFIHPAFPSEVRQGFLANTEFRDLVLEAMRDGIPPAPRRRHLVLAVAPTTRQAFLCAMADGRWAVLQTTGAGSASLLRASSPDTGYLPGCLGTFLRYRTRFHRERGR